jgi:hypothetical protein
VEGDDLMAKRERRGRRKRDNYEFKGKRKIDKQVGCTKL